ncbi:hypothetical protein ABEB36_013081 [Hypothenemus hampei]|uniref:Uncharacterized protein n=1 Tax=Hypothenemus hampei TaxID=57062 RepID=A0ABD1E6R1_HYPHA
MPLTNPFAKNELYGYQTLHREIGYYISRLEHYDKALKFFDEAIKKTPDDKRALIGRSRARSKVIQYQGALEDVNRALNLDPDDLVVLADKALNTYLCCEFEEGLIQNIRMLPKRQKPENFKMGQMQCADAIENCIGDRAGRPLRDYFKIIRKLAWKQNYTAQKPFEPKPTNMSKKKIMLSKLLEFEGIKEPAQPKHLNRRSTFRGSDPTKPQIRDSLHLLQRNNEPIPKYTKPFPYRPLQRHTTNIQNYMAEKYLNSMYLDKIFLLKIQSEPGAKSANVESSKKIHQLAKDCYKTVSYKQELLRTRRPFYFIKYQDAKISTALQERQKRDLELQQQNIKKEADILCKRMLDAYNRKELKIFLDKVEKLKKYCDNKPKRMLPNKQDYMQEIYNKVCSAFYDIYRLNPDHSMFHQTRRIYSLLGKPLSREQSRDSVISQFKNVFIDYKKKIQDFTKRLENATTEEEVCWYYHELSRLEYDTKHFDLCQLYANKCKKEAQNLGNLKWVFNSIMLSVKSNLAEHNKNDAKNDLAMALACAQKLNDPDKMVYVEKCQEVVENIAFENVFGTKQLEKRKTKIIQMMGGSNMKEDAAHLFRQMEAMPASRRMTMIPGVREEDSKDQRTSIKKRNMSIMPSSKEMELSHQLPTGIKDFIMHD